MKIDISAVNKVSGAELKINESGIIEDLKDVFGFISITGPVVFKGVLTNRKELLRLEGEAHCTYKTQCDRCGGPITRTHRVTIREDLFEKVTDDETGHDDEEYFSYQGNWLDLGKILSDNIALTLPMQHLCKGQCEILCQKCGKPVTGLGCDCEGRQQIDPRLAVLKDFINNKQDNRAN
jgi:uncharacterized protein